MNGINNTTSSKTAEVSKSSAMPGYVASDFVITPDWCAKDIVDYFSPSGIILDPCVGDGAFSQYMDGCEWCEITRGKDFFEFNKKVDWIVGNPPYSIFNKWLQHSFEIADNIVYLLPSHKIFNPLGILRIIKNNGWIKHIRVYDTGRGIEWARSRPIIAIHLQRNYIGDTSWSFVGGELVT